MIFKVNHIIRNLNNLIILNNKLIFIFSYFYSVFSLLIYYFGVGLKFSFFRTMKMDSTFGDLRSITFSSGCEKEINLLRSISDNCDPYNRPFNYPRLILDIFRGFNINRYDTELVGLILGLCFIICITIISFK